jgi:hypothetical protein
MRTITPSVELDATCWQHFVTLALAMLRGELPTDARPDIPPEDFKGLTDATNAIFDLYAKEGPSGAWYGVTSLIPSYPHLARRFTVEPASLLAAPPRTVKVYTAEELLNLPPVTFLDADHTLQERGTTMIIGQPGTGKSLWMLRKLHELSNHFPTLVIAAEAQAGLSDRVRALQIATGRAMSEHFKTIMEPLNLRSEADVALIIREAQACKARLVAFDTWAACTAGADENSVRDVTPLFTTLEHIKTTVGCAILLIHHTRKDGSMYRGSSAIHGALDNMFVLNNEDDEITLKPVKTRDSGKQTLKHYRIVEFETRYLPDGSGPIKAAALLPAEQVQDEEPERGSLSRHQRTVLEALDGFTNGLTAQMIERATGLGTGTVHRALRRMQKAGLVTQEKWGAPYILAQAGQTVLANRLP